MCNGESAALKAPKFSKPNDRAFDSMFDNAIDDFSRLKKTSIKHDKSTADISDRRVPAKVLLAKNTINGKRRSLLMKQNMSTGDISVRVPFATKESSIQPPKISVGEVREKRKAASATTSLPILDITPVSPSLLSKVEPLNRRNSASSLLKSKTSEPLLPTKKYESKSITKLATESRKLFLSAQKEASTSTDEDDDLDEADIEQAKTFF